MNKPPRKGEGLGVTSHPPHLARLELSERQRLERIRTLLVECTDNALEHVKGLTSNEDEAKRNKGTQLLAVLSPSAVKVYQLGEYEARLDALEQAVASMKPGDSE
jgi:hypothetical protein